MPPDVHEDRIPWSTVSLAVACTAAFCAFIGIFLIVWAYHHGKQRGGVAERDRLLARERAQHRSAVTADPSKRDAAFFEQVTRGISTSGSTPSRDTWCFGPMECARIVWPMEIARASHPDTPPASPLVFRVRQGANRFAQPGTALAEFVFDLQGRASVCVYVRCRFQDECANTLECQIDGRRSMWIVGEDVFNVWRWEQSPRSAVLKEGLHRVTIGSCEDGLEFDRVVVVVFAPGGIGMQRPDLDAIAITTPPAFESFPTSSEMLPEIDGVTVQSFASDSLVIGRGHRNTLTTYARLNGTGPFDGSVRITNARGFTLETRRLHLDASLRSVLMTFDLQLTQLQGYFVPVNVEARDFSRVISRQELRFISPLSWAFLGPFQDPERKGLDLRLPPDEKMRQLWTLPDVEGMSWKKVSDGSCYDEFGLVDLNTVFGFENKRWEDVPDTATPMVAYAMTCVESGESHHTPVAFGGDDCISVWVNGRRVLRTDCASPIETSRQVVGVPLEYGLPTRSGRAMAFPIVLKVTQTGYYWQILLEPDESLPYGRPARFSRCVTPPWEMPPGFPVPYELEPR